MKIILRFSSLLLLLFPSHSPCRAQGISDLTVLNFSWTRWQQPLDAEPQWDSPPSAARPPMSDEDRKVVERRYGDKMRSDELKKVERDAAKSSVRSGPAYVYKAKVQNAGAKTIAIFYWEYQFKESADPENLTRRQFVCAVQVKANKRKEVAALSASPPTNVISAKTLGGNSQQPFQESVLINRIEYADGSIWQRADWSPPERKIALSAQVSQDLRSEGCLGF